MSLGRPLRLQDITDSASRRGTSRTGQVFSSSTTLSRDKADILYRSCTAYAIKTLLKHDAERGQSEYFTALAPLMPFRHCSSTTLSRTKRVFLPLLHSLCHQDATYSTPSSIAKYDAERGQSEYHLPLLHCLCHQDTRYIAPSRHFPSTTLSRTKRVSSTVLALFMPSRCDIPSRYSPITTLSKDKASIVYRSCTAYATKTRGTMTPSRYCPSTTLSKDKASIVYCSCTAYAIKMRNIQDLSVSKHDAERGQSEYLHRSCTYYARQDVFQARR
jgi:hypothetical protein